MAINHQSSRMTGAGLYDGWWSNDPYSHRPASVSQGSVSMGGGNVWPFDLSKDETEEINVAAQSPDIARAAMQARLGWLADKKNGTSSHKATFLTTSVPTQSSTMILGHLGSYFKEHLTPTNASLHEHLNREHLNKERM